MWQDYLFMTGNFIFVVALLPSVIGEGKPARLTCLITSSVLYAFCIGYATLGLWLSFGATIATATLWFVLLLQGRKRVR